MTQSQLPIILEERSRYKERWLVRDCLKSILETGLTDRQRELLEIVKKERKL